MKDAFETMGGKRMIRLIPLAALAVSVLALGGATCKRKMKKLEQYHRELWTAEVDGNLDRIYQALERLWLQAKDKNEFVFPVAGPTPPRVPCGTRPHRADPSLWQDQGWKKMGFSINKKFRYQYRVLSFGKGANAGFTIRAFGDLDCDGDYATYELLGAIKQGKLHDFGGKRFDEQRATE